MAKTVTERAQQLRDLEAFSRYFGVTEGPTMPSDLRLLEYCAGSLGMPQDQLIKLLGLHGKVGTTV